jgi:hypothetical protein
MIVSKQWLEAKVKELNDWLKEHEKGVHFEYAQKKQNRDYYVGKLIELEESGIQKIKV